MKDKIILSTLIVMSIFLTGCNDWLNNARSVEKLDRTQLLKSESGIKGIWNGTYMDLANSASYGRSMTITTIELLAQRYATSNEKYPFRDANIAAYKYTEDKVKDEFLAIWKRAYATIAGINLFISDIEKSTVITDPEKRNLLLGEAYGLRAFVHFDMFRLFGPVYSEKTKKEESIPYCKRIDPFATPFLPADSVLALVLTDLNKSIELLADDPVRVKGGREAKNGESLNDFYGKMRVMRFNYFAAKATKARVLLYMGGDSIPVAGQVAGEVITEASQFFPFVSISEAAIDKKYYSEVLFMLHNPQISDYNDVLFVASASNKDRNVIAITTLNPNFGLNNTMSLSATTDVRRHAYYLTPESTSSYTTFQNYVTSKFNIHPETASPYRSYLNTMQPLIRISEMYYILAEATGDISQLDVVRDARMADKTITSVTDEVLKNEYYLDTAFEGQLFFFYKRKDWKQIKNGNDGTAVKEMTETQYVVPLPVEETGKYD